MILPLSKYSTNEGFVCLVFAFLEKIKNRSFSLTDEGKYWRRNDLEHPKCQGNEDNRNKIFFHQTSSFTLSKVNLFFSLINLEEKSPLVFRIISDSVTN